MRNLQEIVEALVVGNMALRKARTEDDIEAAAADIDAAVSRLCELTGLDRHSLETFRLADGRRRAA